MYITTLLSECKCRVLSWLSKQGTNTHGVKSNNTVYNPPHYQLDIYVILYAIYDIPFFPLRNTIICDV